LTEQDEPEIKESSGYFKRESGGLGKKMGRFLETDLDKKKTDVRIFQFIFPWFLWVVFATLTTSLVLILGAWGEAQEMLYVWIFYTIPPLGKETIIPTVVANGVPPLIAGLSVTLVDVIFSLFLIWNYDWVKKIPVLGKMLERTEEKGRQKVSKNKWFKRLTFTATTFFVLIPASGSGGIGGTIFGRIVGMKPYRVLLAVVIGSLIGSIGYATLSGILIPILDEFVLFKFLTKISVLQIFAVMLAIVIILYIIRYPRRAAERTSRFIQQSLILAKKAVLGAEGLRKEGTELTVKSSKETIDWMEKMSDHVDDINLSIATGPMMILGRHGKEYALATREKGKKRISRAKKKATGFVFRSIDDTRKTADRTFETATNMTIVGIEAARSGVESTGYLIILAGEKIEKVIRIPEDFIRRNRKKPEE
jgi:uncharacterized membrane protein